MKLFITSSPNTFTTLIALQVLYKNNGSLASEKLCRDDDCDDLYTKY